jgi:Sulfotransferase family
MKQPGYIFIVGLSRTGSTLTRNILNCSEDVGISDETHFFGSIRRLGVQTRQGFWQQLAKVGDISTDGGAEKVVDYIYNIRKKSFWARIAKSVDREEFLRRVLESDRNDRSLFDLAMAFYANGKPIRGEKTPAHIYFVPTLLKWFPNAKIIHTFRDPRAVYISQRRKSEKRTDLPLYHSKFRQLGLVSDLYSSFNVITAWLRVIQLHYQYQQLYPNNYYLSKYEDLIRDPRSSLQKLCDFLEIKFTGGMLQPTNPNSSFIPRNQMQGFDAQAIDRWRKHLDPVIHKWFALWCKKHLFEFGYQL